MRGFSTELKVGIFALFVLGVLAFMTLKVGGLEWARAKGYVLYVYFNNTAGLDEKTRVKVAGVDAGVIERIDLYEGRARVALRIDPKVKIYRDARAAIKTTGLLGDRFIHIYIGSSALPQMKDGETIENVTEFVDMDDMARNLMTFSRSFTKLTDSLNEVLSTEGAKESLSETIVNLREVSAALNRTIDVNDQKLRRTLDNINNLTVSLNSLVEKNSDQITSTVQNMKDFSSSLKTSGPEVLESLNKASRELRAMVEENRPGVKETVESLGSIAKRIDKGEGTLGKLVKDDRLYESVSRAAEGVNKTISAVDRFKTFISFQTEYLSKPREGKGYVYVTLQPTPEKYYILGVVGDPIARIKTTDTTITPPGTTVKEEEFQKKIEFTAHYAKRFGDAAMRIGLTENSFGVGGDYFFNNDMARVTADVWDFSKDEEGARNPHAKVGLDYFLFKNVFVSAGIDNIFNSKWRGAYIGAGLRFEDEDFKYLLGTLPRISP